MTGTGISRSSARRAASLIAAVASAALIVAPAAWANTTTIGTAAGVQFHGWVDSDPACEPAGTAVISWGDNTGTSAGSVDPTTGNVTGTHTYASQGTYFGHVTLTGNGCDTQMTDDFTANVGAAPQFTECPQIGADVGCQFLIDVTPGGTAVLGDSSQPPYENSEDALIAVKNDSSSPLSSIPLSTPGSALFSFDSDGLCDNGTGPVPAGCQPIQGAPAGTTCEQGAGSNCAFPEAPGQPGADLGAYAGSTQNGYEGPQNYYTNISTDQTSGVVNFSPALQPGQSTYFSLEEPPSASAINVGSQPQGVGLTSPPTVTATSAAFVGVVNPNGSATTAQFQFNLDPRYGKLADVTQSTASQSVGGDFANHVVTTMVTGLDPNAVYQVRLVATNKNGQTVGTDVTFKTKSAAPPGSPKLGQSFNLAPVRGVVLIKVRGAFVPLTQLRQFPKNTVIDALGGTLRIITAAGGGPARDATAAKAKKGKGKGKTQSGTFSGAVFKLSQAHSGLATLALVENAFKGGPSFAKCKARASDVTASAASSKTLQLLHSSATGKFATKGKYAAATVRGTKWTTADRCDGTLVHDVTDSVAVTDFVHHKTIVLHAGQSYLAKKR